MGHIISPLPAKLIMSLFAARIEILETVTAVLVHRFGMLDFESQLIDFNQTTYYEKEFGAQLKRKFISFKKMIPSESLWRIKKTTNRIEERFTRNDNRQINIDPGYLTQANLILASTKMFFHRIHSNRGIYHEVTLIYQDKTFKSLPWTYPDYQTEQAKNIFLQIRALYIAQLKQK